MKENLLFTLFTVVVLIYLFHLGSFIFFFWWFIRKAFSSEVIFSFFFCLIRWGFLTHFLFFSISSILFFFTPPKVVLSSVKLIYLRGLFSSSCFWSYLHKIGIIYGHLFLLPGSVAPGTHHANRNTTKWIMHILLLIMSNSSMGRC